MNIRLIFTIAVSKIIIKACRLVKWGGTSLPGEIARKLYPDVIKEITKDFNTIMVTGTNGKTTATRIISRMLSENNISHITNKSGANLVDGITTTFIENVDLMGKSNVKNALIEIDEAAFNKMTDHLQPNILVITNFFRDQLDRYGELYSTLKKVKAGIDKSPFVKLILNADDSLCASLGKDSLRPAVYYGVDSNAFNYSDKSSNSDAAFCIYCKTRYEYSYRTYGHLGGFHCPGCGYQRPDTQITCTGIDKLTSSYSSIKYTMDNAADFSQDNMYCAKINLPGLYNIYNSLSAIAVGSLMGIPHESISTALENFECGFGRMETIKSNGKQIKLILVKNPAGFNQVINYLLTEEQSISLAILINDRLADGTDVSWLWDVDFEALQDIQDRLCNVYTSGTRAEDMAVRLKYAGVYTDKIKILHDYEELLREGLLRTPEGHSLYILPTYTAMLGIRRVLKQKFNLREFWK
ncbi:UDP-N-acetylmuramyl tripeptide synthase [Anaerobacterium chartisolvens]|uniref:Lipid II isoglutaminyl synthase (glutamine-hydrolyzing) subunit MurT n=1 Tax=Anaerobacterium chartisolvens TaxID=1297424 RepID=A0A369B236_9FIRM|nr:MurT ligase domain-containing protein [Anaerobacterium chartisolvens]RCX15481.1 UDP-N-acetylmuramyl tripeptide synthase [Anaerobacterium chartisolvens]